MNPSSYSSLISTEALRLGFDYCGFSRADFLEEEAPRLEQWLLQNKHGKMKYMENYFDKRLDPRKLVDGAKSVVSLLYNYFPEQKQTHDDAPKISTYAYGTDYHVVIKEKLKALLHFINNEIGEVNGRCFVDSAPVMEREWAQRAGIGWNGRNTLTINPKRGSFFFLAEIICDLPLLYDDPIRDHCGTCRRCIDACHS